MRRAERPVDEGGVAMVVATIVGTLLLLAATTVVTVASRDVLHTRRTNGVLEARRLAEAALDAVAATAAADPGALDRVAGGEPTWATFDGFGRRMPCPAVGDGCSRVAVRVEEVAVGATQRRVRIAVVEATGRSGCRTGRCTLVRLQQRLERRTFLDFLVHTDLELVDPSLLPDGDGPGTAGYQRRSCEQGPDGARRRIKDRPADCVVPAWFGSAGIEFRGDDADGPVHTNDELLPVCGSPTFRGPVETTAGPGETGPATRDSTFVDLGPLLCGRTTGTPALAGDRAVLRTAPALALPADVRHLDAAAADGHGLRYPGPGEAPLAEAAVTVRADGRLDVVRTEVGGATRCACPVDGPDSGVLFVDAPTVRVLGSTPFPLTIATTGTAIVDGDLGITDDAVSGAAVGVIAEGRVVIQMADRSTGGVRYRRLQGVALVSLAHTVMADRWNDPTVCARMCPSLLLEGAVVSRYRPLIGSYDTETGELAGGYRKQMRYLPSLADRPPPYLLSEGRSAWRRVDAVETGAGTSGLIDG